MKELEFNFGALTNQEFIQTPLTHLKSLYLLPLNNNRTLCPLAMTATGWSDLNCRRRHSLSMDSDFSDSCKDGQRSDEELPHSVVQLVGQQLELELEPEFGQLLVLELGLELDLQVRTRQFYRCCQTVQSWDAPIWTTCPTVTSFCSCCCELQ